ncbi:MAG: isochorismate synthase [Vicinamibacterales bacterium]
MAVHTAGSNHQFEPEIPFILASGEERLVASGVTRLAPLTSGTWLAQGAALLASAEHDEATIVGALPFDHARPAHLYQPRLVTRERQSRLVAPSTSSMVSRQWRATGRPSRRDYERQVASVLPRLDDGSGRGALRKVVLARSLELEADGPIDIGRLFAQLALDPSITAFQVPLPDAAGLPRVLIGATPELLIDKADEFVTSLPLAGSAPRSRDAAADRAAGERLRHSAKDAREHAVVVEWIADQLTRYCRKLSVPAMPSLTSTHSMWHLASHIEGELHDADVSSLELAEVLHPTPAVCGLPSPEALQEIGRIETFDRAFFAGAIGWANRRGDGRWLMTLRCADIAGHTATLYAGAGIVHGSEPEAEGAETSAKLVAMLDALGVDEDGHAMLVDL